MTNAYWTSILVSPLYYSDILISGSSRPGQVGDLAALGFSSHKLCPLCQVHAHTDTRVHKHTLTPCAWGMGGWKNNDRCRDAVTSQWQRG